MRSAFPLTLRRKKASPDGENQRPKTVQERQEREERKLSVCVFLQHPFSMGCTERSYDIREQNRLVCVKIRDMGFPMIINLL